MKPGEPLPPSRTWRNRPASAATPSVAAYERLIADGFAEAVRRLRHLRRNTHSRPRQRSPQASSYDRDAHSTGVLSLGCTHIDERSLQRFRAFVGRRHAHLRQRASALWRSARQPRAARRDRRSSAVGARPALRSRPDHAHIRHAAQRCGSCSARSSKLATRSGARIPAIRIAARPSSIAATAPCPVPVDEHRPARRTKAAPRRRRARAAYVTPSHQFPLGVQMSMPRRLELLDWAKAAGALRVRGRLRQRVPL